MLWACWGATLHAQPLCNNFCMPFLTMCCMHLNLMQNRATLSTYKQFWCETPHLQTPSFFKQAIMSQGYTMPADTSIATTDSQSSGSRDVHLCVPRSFIFPGLSISYLSCYLQPMAICHTSVCFLFNGEHQQSDAIRAALMTGWLPNPARFHALLMLTCQIRHWNGEIWWQTEKRVKDWKIWHFKLGYVKRCMPCGRRNNRRVKMGQRHSYVLTREQK